MTRGQSPSPELLSRLEDFLVSETVVEDRKKLVEERAFLKRSLTTHLHISYFDYYEGLRVLAALDPVVRQARSLLGTAERLLRGEVDALSQYESQFDAPPVLARGSIALRGGPILFRRRPRRRVGLSWDAMSTLAEYVRSNGGRFENELFEFLRIPSISTLPDHRADMLRAAAFVSGKLAAAGLENVEVIENAAGRPLVYGDWLHARGKPTVLFYGHYDVQPVDPLELWESPPFEPTVRNGSVYARGAPMTRGSSMHTSRRSRRCARRTGNCPLTSSS